MKPGLFCTQTSQESYACLKVLVHGIFHVLILKGILKVQQKLQEKGEQGSTQRTLFLLFT